MLLSLAGGPDLWTPCLAMSLVARGVLCAAPLLSDVCRRLNPENTYFLACYRHNRIKTGSDWSSRHNAAASVSSDLKALYESIIIIVIRPIIIIIIVLH